MEELDARATKVWDGGEITLRSLKVTFI